MKKGSIKNNRINEEVLRALSKIIRDEVKDPRVDPLLSLTRVEVSPDLMFAKVYVSSLSGDSGIKRSLEGLESSSGFIRKELSAQVNLRKTPKLEFIADRNMAYAFEMSRRIDELSDLGGMGAEEETYVGETFRRNTQKTDT